MVSRRGQLRGRVASILALLVLLAGCQQPAPEALVDPRNQRASAPATLPYSITRESDALVVRRGGSGLPIEADLDVPDAHNVVPVPGDRFAVLAGRKLAVLDSQGAGPIVAVDPDCGSLTNVGERLLMICPGSDIQGSEFRVGIFDLALNEVDRLELNRVHERAGVKPRDGNDGPPTLLAAGPEVMWIAYTDRKGWGRWGSRLIAKHDYQGRVLATLRLDGVIYDSTQSPDGRYLAMFAGGSSGAYDTLGNLRVIDLGSMTTLNTAPDAPAAAMRDSQALDDIYFTGSELHWIDSEHLIAVGATEHHAKMGTDRPRLWWERRFDVGGLGVTDRAIPEPAADGEQGWLGPGCDDVIEPVSRDSGGVLMQDGLRIRQGDQSRTLTDAWLLYGAPKPKECGP